MEIPEWFISSFDVKVETPNLNTFFYKKNLLKGLLILNWSLCSRLMELELPNEWKKCGKMNGKKIVRDFCKCRAHFISFS